MIFFWGMTWALYPCIPGFHLIILFLYLHYSSPGWWNGRHAGLKILWPLRLCGFKSRSGYPEAQEVKLASCFFLWHSSNTTNSRDEMYSNFWWEGCNFFFEENEFFVRVATKVPLLYNPLLNLHKIPAIPRAIASGSFYEITHIWIFLNKIIEESSPESKYMGGVERELF